MKSSSCAGYATKGNGILRIPAVSVLVIGGVAGMLFGETVTLDVGSNFEDIVGAHPAGTKYIIKSGIHYFQTIHVKTGDTIIGEDGAVMCGARILSNWVKEGNFWVHGGQTQQGTILGEVMWCASPDDFLGRDTDLDSTLCLLPEDLFMDNLPLQRRSYLSDVSSGRWYFDYNTDKVYMADDPNGHTMEISVTDDIAIEGTDISNVTIKNIIIEKYASPAHYGCIGGRWPGSGWVVENCVVRLVHGLGLNVTDKFIVRNCRLLWCGQMGVYGCQNGLFELNEVAYCNFNHYMEGWGAGGTKFDCRAETDSVVLRGNYVHHNTGISLWCDGAAKALYEGNIVEYNRAHGLMFEVSRQAEIRCNVCRFNGMGHRHPMANLLNSNSGDCDVHHNIVVAGQPSGGQGCGISSSSDSRGPFNGVINFNSHHNDITFMCEGYYSSTGSNSDIYTDEFLASRNYQWDYNSYHTSTPNYEHWLWKGPQWGVESAYHTFSEWQSCGFDIHGSMDTDISADRPLPDECADCRQYIDHWRNGTTATVKPVATPRTGTARIKIAYDAAVKTVRIGTDKASAGMLVIRVYNAMGREVKVPRQAEAGRRNIELHLSALGRNVYFVEARCDSDSRLERIVAGR